MSREMALTELARRYLEAYGPAGPEDLASWSGLPKGDARAAWKLVADQTIELEIAGRSAWMLKTSASTQVEPQAPLPVPRLLPRFDTHLLGYASRDLVVAPQHAKRIHPGGGLLRPTMLVDGRAVGVWSSRRRGRRLDVIVELFEHLSPAVVAGLEEEVTDMGRFLGMNTAWSFSATA